jgi:prepilin-type N-terminal cleavage/methylation domain-containing protein
VRARGFTAVELLIAVTIAGILAALGTRGVTKYIGNAYAAEAVQNLGGIRRAVVTVHAMQVDPTTSSTTTTDTTGGGNGGKKGGKNNGNSGNDNGAEVTHGVTSGLCPAADPVPADFAKVKARKYQPKPSDYGHGNPSNGWTCLRYNISTPQAYQYGYDLGGPKVQVELPHGGNPAGLAKGQQWTAWARGDRDGDGQVSWFVMTGAVADGVFYAPPGVGMVNEGE